MKNTKARAKILEILKQAQIPLSADEIIAKLNDPTINVSTVYRTLKTFEEKQLVTREISLKDRQSYYSLHHSDEHYHILECVKCHEKIKLDYCPYDEANEKIFKETGFTITDENKTIYGLCNKCKKIW